MDIRTTKRLNNGVEIPLLGLGVFKAGKGRETEEAVRTALEAGYRHVDTAAAYENEEDVGKGLRSSGVPREQVFITTKLWNEDQRRGRQREAFEESLRRLGTDYVDLYLVHWPVPGAFVSSWKVMEEIYRSGRARAIGVSNFQARHLDTLAKTASVPPAANQVECHPRLSQAPLREYCRRAGIAVEAWSPLGGAVGDLLTDPRLAALADRKGRTVAQVILRWDLQHGMVTIPKSVRRERILSNAALYDFELTAEEMREVDAMNTDRRFGPSPDAFDF
jgi:diketogulonate reductase-like aldo/keto reductase